MSSSTARVVRWTVVVLLAVGVRLGAGLWWDARIPEPQRFAMPDSNSYWSLAQTMVRGQPYHFGSHELRVFRTPGYPAILAALFVVLRDDDPPVIWARGLNAVLGSLAVVLVGCLAWRLFDESTGLLAAALIAVYPGAIAMSTFVLSEGPFCPLMMGQLLCWAIAWRMKRRGRSAMTAGAAGALAGLATLVRPSWLLFTPFALLIGLIVGSRQRHAWLGAWMLLGLVLTMSPWWVRNYQVTGSFVPTTLQMGASLYDGWNPQADGSSEMSFVPQFWDAQRAADAAAVGPLQGTFEQRLDRRLRTAAVDWAAHHPREVSHLAGIKFLRMWNVWPNDQQLQSWWFRMLVMIGFVPLLVFGLLGAWRFVPREWPYLLCLVPAIYFTWLHMIFVSSIRYRQPAMLPLSVLSAGLLVMWLRRGKVASASASRATVVFCLLAIPVPLGLC